MRVSGIIESDDYNTNQRAPRTRKAPVDNQRDGVQARRVIDSKVLNRGPQHAKTRRHLVDQGVCNRALRTNNA